MAFDVLSPNTVLEKKLVLEASAGTGKTFTIEHLFIRFMLEKKIPFHSLLVLTFTKAATRELKMRIRTNLQSIIANWENREKIPHYLQEKYHTKESLQLLREALVQFDQTLIFTIHGFCHAMLQQHAVATPYGFFTPPDENLAFLQSFLKKWLMSSELLQPFEIAIVLKHFSYQLDLFVGAICQNLQPSEEASLYDILEDVYPLITEKKLSSFLSDHVGDFKISGFHLPTIFEEIALWEKMEASSDFESFKENAFSFFSLQPSLCSFFQSSNLKKKAKVDSETLSVCDAVFIEVQKALNPKRIFQVICQKIKDPLFETLLENNLMTPDFLMERMRKSLSHEAFCRSVRSQVKVVIVDEFQDTDPLQWEILSTLFEDDSNFFYVVGDPKQSIYGFRNADIYTYIKAKSILKTKAVLHCNFRSTETLVSAFNHLFGHTSFLLPKHNENLTYQNVDSVKKGDATEDAIHFFAANVKPSAQRFPSKQEETALFFPFVIQEIMQLRTENLSEIAILVKDRHQGNAVSHYLSQQGIPSFWHKQEKHETSDLFAFFKDLLKAVVAPYDEGKIKAALFGPFADFDPQTIPEAIPYEIMTIFYSLHNALQRSISTFVTLLLKSSFDGKATVLERITQRELMYEKLLHLCELMENWSTPFTPNTIDLFFNEIEKKESRLFTPSTDGVQILTIHKSKGLEFSYVFALGLMHRTRPTKNSFRDLKELDAEKQRQFYVALTRAKKKVYVPVAIDNKEKEIPDGIASPTELFFSHALQEPLSLDLIESFLSPMKINNITFSRLSTFELTPRSKASKKELFPPPEINLSYDSCKTISFSSSIEEKIKIPTFSPTKQGPSGTSFGLFVHECLRQILLTQVSENEAAMHLKKEIALSPFFAHDSMITQMIITALYRPLFGETPLMALSNDQRFTEMPFHFVSSSKEIWTGIIDLWFMQNGKIYLLDWKTNDLGDDPASYEEKALYHTLEEDNYFKQGSIYSQALRQHLTASHFDFEKLFGGAYFVFLRGLQYNRGIYHYFPKPMDELC
jgi:exodeoxyribonuclease V beta subunit